MASNAPGNCCATGFKHEGNPAGELVNIRGVQNYIARPADQRSPEKVVIILSDIFGVSFINNQLLADDFAARGYLAIVPDLFKGDPIRFGDIEDIKVQLPSWFPNHQPIHVDPIVESTIQYVRDDLGATRVAAAGYCFGAKYVCRYLKDGGFDVGYLAHPSHVSHEELAPISGPLSIAASEIDEIFTTQLRHESEDILIKNGQPWQINLYGGVTHGFAVRTDLSNMSWKFAKEQAFVQAVDWFNHYLYVNEGKSFFFS
ncbi:uncharacterized protein N7496_008040 [Penicillium cataractarum]|uniref:Dienelactone hydrolase domain-containing protein n=1 Tax=Penicillium cataractarum TaxID=2100454 RepID=A0A9W9RYZ5_9EURO|nr:uncharacterized protein N7496_008040 [Penicillium cataractarum]KAJ5368280.1 hypothetical protein N7496_008040 [Penicillium cataractarum]